MVVELIVMIKNVPARRLWCRLAAVWDSTVRIAVGVGA